MFWQKIYFPLKNSNKIGHSSRSSSIKMSKTSADKRTKRKKKKTEKKEKREKKTKTDYGFILHILYIQGVPK